jgi:hypothetical protein
VSERRQAGCAARELCCELLVRHTNKRHRVTSANSVRRMPAVPPPRPACFHGSECWAALAADFHTLERRYAVINADVLDAWFDPAPAIVERVGAMLPFLL